MEIRMRKITEYGAVFGIGAAGYGVVEILWRGYTHWTMVLTGGICLSCIYFSERCHCSAPIWKRCLVGSLVISLSEILVGFVVNMVLGWGVWDYSSLPMNLFGQICALYSTLWFLLCLPVTQLCAWLRKILGGDGKKA